MKAMNINVVRFWAFQDFAANNNGGLNWGWFDTILKVANENGIYAMPVFINQLHDCQGDSATGTALTPSWYQPSSYPAYWNGLTAPNHVMSYKAYVMAFVQRYRTHNGIFAYQIGNELAGSWDDAWAGNMVSFAKDIAGTIRSYSSNLISFGTRGEQDGATVGPWSPTYNNRWLTYYYNIHAIENVDMVTFHDYADADPSSAWLKVANAIALRLNKPIVLSEFGIGQRNRDCATINSMTDNKINAYEAAGAAGIMAWHYVENPVITENDGLQFNSATCLGQKLASRFNTFKTKAYPNAFNSFSPSQKGSFYLDSSTTCAVSPIVNQAPGYQLVYRTCG